jgi:hypothetical protein
MASPETLGEGQTVRRSVVVGRGLGSGCWVSHVLWGCVPSPRVWRGGRRVGVAPRTNRIVVGGVGTAGEGRGGRVFGRGWVQPGVLDLRAALVLWRDGAFGRHEGLGDALVADGVGFKRRQRLARLLNLDRSLGTPSIPMRTPRSETILLVVDAVVDFPVKREQPFQFHVVQLGNGDAADLGPGFVLEGVVIEELTAQQKRNSQHAVDLATSWLVRPLGRQHTHAAGQVKQTEQNGGTWQASRGQNLKDVFPKLRGYRRSWVDASREVNICKGDVGLEQIIHSLSHFCHEVGHAIHLVIQVSCDTSSSFFLLAGLFGLLNRSRFLAAVLRGDRSIHGWELDVAAHRRQSSGGHRVEHVLVHRMDVASSIHRVDGLGVQVHRSRLGVAKRLRILFDELIATLMVARRESCVTNRVERWVFHATTVDMGRRRQAMVAWDEEGRHLEKRGRGASSGRGARRVLLPKAKDQHTRLPGYGKRKEPDGPRIMSRRNRGRTVYSTRT